MADIKLSDLDFLHIEDEDDARLIIHEIEEEFIKLEKRIRKRLKGLVPQAMKVLGEQAVHLGKMLEGAFTVDSLGDYTRAAAIYGEELAGSLYELQMELSGLQNAIIRAAAPIVQVFLPVVRAAVTGLTALAESIGRVLRVLFFGSEYAQDFSESLQGAVSAGTKLKRTLVGFDELNRLGESGDSFGGSIPVVPPMTLPEGFVAFSEALLKLFEPLKNIDLTPAAESLKKLTEALAPITKELFAGLEWAWYNLFVPLAQWAAEELLPAFLEGITMALKSLGIVIQELKPAFLWLWENYLKPLAQWKGDQIVAYLRQFAEGLGDTSNAILGSLFPLGSWILSGKNLISTLAEMCEKTLTLAEFSQMADNSFSSFLKNYVFSRGFFAGTNSGLGSLLGVFGQLATVFGSVSVDSEESWAILEEIWGDSGEYMEKNVTAPATEGVKAMSNSMIGIVNGMSASVLAGFNAVGQALNTIGFTVPNWIPGLGGNSIEFFIPYLSVPPIPMLAKGAVLPANRPFMAVVGDQRSGTNVEAPLSTIQEAVALVMEDYAAANMAGHEATVEVLRELLSAVLGIRIGDEAIASAVDRYDRKMAMVRGG